jgi:hypothetical protein
MSARTVMEERPRPSALTPLLRHEVRAFAESFFADDEGPPPSDRLDWALDDLGQMLAHAGTRARLLFRVSVLTMAFLVPLILLGRPARFSSLSAPDRLEALHRAERSPAGLAVFLVRAMTSLVYYEHPDASASIGWDKSCLLAAEKRAPVLDPQEEVSA